MLALFRNYHNHEINIMYKLCNVGFLTNLIVLYFAEKDFILHVTRERQHAISILEEAPWKLYSNAYHAEYGSKSSQDP